MSRVPGVDESRDRLHRAGWSVGETAVGPGHALVGVVSGTNGDVDQPYCLLATQQAAAVGMLAPPRRELGGRL